MCVWEDDLKQLQATFQTFEGDFITVQEFEVQSELTVSLTTCKTQSDEVQIGTAVSTEVRVKWRM